MGKIFILQDMNILQHNYHLAFEDVKYLVQKLLFMHPLYNFQEIKFTNNQDSLLKRLFLIRDLNAIIF